MDGRGKTVSEMKLKIYDMHKDFIPELLRGEAVAANVPKDLKIQEVFYNFETGVLQFKAESNTFQDVPDGWQIEHVPVIARRK